MVALVNEILSSNQWLQRFCFLSQSDTSPEIYCWLHVPKCSPAFRLSCAVIDRSEWWILFRREKDGSCNAQAHWDERNRAVSRTRLAADYAEGSQPSDKIYEWNNYFKILSLSIAAGSTPTRWTAHVTFCGWPGCSRRHQTRRLQLHALSPRICKENHWWDSRQKISTAVSPFNSLEYLTFRRFQREMIIFQHILVKMNRFAIRCMKCSFW